MESQLQAPLDSGIVSFKATGMEPQEGSRSREQGENVVSLTRHRLYDFGDGEASGSGNLSRIDQKAGTRFITKAGPSTAKTFLA